MHEIKKISDRYNRKKKQTAKEREREKEDKHRYGSHLNIPPFPLEKNEHIETQC